VSEARSLVADLHARGVAIRMVGDRLRYRPMSAVPPELRARMAACKDDLLDLVQHFEERAAIREFDGGLSRAEAEQLAWEDVLAAARWAS